MINLNLAASPKVCRLVRMRRSQFGDQNPKDVEEKDDIATEAEKGRQKSYQLHPILHKSKKV